MSSKERIQVAGDVVLADKIRLMIVDDIAEIRTNLGNLLSFEEDFEVVGEAGNGEEAVSQARTLMPDVMLMDINMPVMDGIQATQLISVESPQIGIIILSVQGEQEYLRKAMAAGARDYLTKPPSSDDLINTIRQVAELQKQRKVNLAVTEEAEHGSGTVISVFSPKGGVGKSTLAVNLAVALAQQTGKKTVLMDLALQFGDVAMMLDIVPRRTISDLAGEPDLQKIATLETYLSSHDSGLKVLAGPLRPEYAEIVTAHQIESIMQVLRENFEYVIVDTHQAIDDITLAILDQSDQILTVAALDVLSIKNIKLVLEVMASLHYEASKIKLVLNRVGIQQGISPESVASSLKYPISWDLPGDSKTVVAAVNQGIPFVMGEPKAPIAESVIKLARQLAGMPEEQKEKSAGFSWRGLFGGK